MNGRESRRLEEIGGKLGVTKGDLIEIRRKRAVRKLRIGIGATIAAAASAALGYNVGLLSPNRPEQLSYTHDPIYPLSIIPIATAVPLWPIRQALVKRSHKGLTLAGLIVLLAGIAAFLIAYALGASTPIPPAFPGLTPKYGVAHR